MANALIIRETIIEEVLPFNFKAYRTETDSYGVTRDFKEYVAEKLDEQQQVISESLTSKGNLRKIKVNPLLEYFKAKQSELLTEPETNTIYAQRKIDVESAFGHLKTCLGSRLSVLRTDKREK